jgi:hypothetical protein
VLALNLESETVSSFQFNSPDRLDWPAILISAERGRLTPAEELDVDIWPEQQAQGF